MGRILQRPRLLAVCIAVVIIAALGAAFWAFSVMRDAGPDISPEGAARPVELLSTPTATPSPTGEARQLIKMLTPPYFIDRTPTLDDLSDWSILLDDAQIQGVVSIRIRDWRIVVVVDGDEAASEVEALIGEEGIHRPSVVIRSR